MKYRFDQYDVDITNPTVTVTCVHEDLILKYCDVDVELKVDDAVFRVTLGGLTYDDKRPQISDIIDWANIELKNYIVTGEERRYAGLESSAAAEEKTFWQQLKSILPWV